MGYKVELCDVSLKFGENVLLDHINLQMAAGHIYGLVGRNGSGKTVLMKCICGFMHQTEGIIRVGGAVIGRDTDFPKNTGIIIENPEFLPYCSGYGNLKLLADLRGKIGKEQIREAINRVGLNPDLKLPVRKYSLGMRQRLGIAQAIMENPLLLILDEPMNGLDEDGVRQMRALLLKLKAEGKTILLASHSAEDIAILCDTVFKIEKGRLKNSVM